MIPPRNFSLPEPDANLSPDAIARLAGIGFTALAELQRFADLFKQGGEITLQDGIARLEKSAKGYAGWFPRLTEFAAECRRRSPSPMDSDLTPAEREEQSILRSKMEAFITSDECHRLFEHRPQSAVIFITTRAALGVAAEIFGRIESGVVFTGEELERWYSEIYDPSNTDHSWYWIQSWTVHREFDESTEKYITRNHPEPDGFEYWDVVSGTSYSAEHELWRFDGTHAKFIESYCIDSFSR